MHQGAHFLLRQIDRDFYSRTLRLLWYVASLLTIFGLLFVDLGLLQRQARAPAVEHKCEVFAKRGIDPSESFGKVFGKFRIQIVNQGAEPRGGLREIV